MRAGGGASGCVGPRTAVRMPVQPTRGAPSGAVLLGDLGRAAAAVLVCDRWSDCKKLQRVLPGTIRLAYYWPHQRRDFWRVATSFPGLRD